MRYLAMQHGFPLHRMSAISYGEFKPIADNKTADGRAQEPPRHPGRSVLSPDNKIAGYRAPGLAPGRLRFRGSIREKAQLRRGGEGFPASLCVAWTLRLGVIIVVRNVRRCEVKRLAMLVLALMVAGEAWAATVVLTGGKRLDVASYTVSGSYVTVQYANGRRESYPLWRRSTSRRRVEASGEKTDARAGSRAGRTA